MPGPDKSASVYESAFLHEILAADCSASESAFWQQLSGWS
jgi:hypothetical protein